MTLYEFRMLSDSEQIDLLYMEGVYIGKRKQDNSIIVLYQLDGFYIEIFYRKYRSVITHVYCFTSTMLLNAYLDQINVEELVKC